MSSISRWLKYWLVLTLSIYGGLANSSSDSLQKKLSSLESSADLRLGISAIDTSNHQTIYYRADERFPIQSTFKLIGVATVLHQSKADANLLNQTISYKKEDLVFWSPITEKNLIEGMSVSELCAAAMMYSDNTAINLLVKTMGGVSKITQFARFLEDNSFRLDHLEPNMNSDPKNAEDSSTPRAMQTSLTKLVLANVLAKREREELVDWMKRNTTGDTRIRAGVPKGWAVADKTGAGDEYGISNDIAIIWPPNHSPIVLAIYSVHLNKNAARRDDVLAEVTRMVLEEFSKHWDVAHP